MRRFFLLLTLALPIMTALGQAQDNVQRLDYRYPALNEMSGLASSRLDSKRVWAHNDSGDKPRLFALSDAGTVVGEVAIDKANAFDWEDMASFTDAEGNPFLLIGDIGDNAALRPFVDVYLLAEPQAPNGKVTVLRRYTLVYPDGPRDAEALAVDSRERFVYLLSKRDRHPRLYRFSLDALKDLFVPLNYLGEVRSIPSRERHAELKAGKTWAISPTAMAFSPTLDAAIVVTPRNSYYFPRRPGENWLDALNRDPQILRPPRLPQIEAGDFSAEGQDIYLGSEGQPATLLVVPRPTAQPPH